MRTAYLGTSEFAATVLGRLAESPHRPALVVTPPDRPRGRGRRLAAPPAAEAARERGIEVLQVASVNDPEPVERLRALDPGAVAVCAFGQLIREPLLSAHLMLNVHPSIVPRWRGAAPIERAIMAGDAETGVAIFRVTEGLDEGPVALAEPLPIAPEDDYGSLSQRLAELGGELLVRALDLQAAGELAFSPQDDEAATYAEKIDPAERRLDPAQPAAVLARTVRALTPHIGAHLQVEGSERLGVLAATPLAGAVAGALEAGALSADGERLLLGCAEGVLGLDVVQPPGGRPMPAADYLRGHSPPARAV